MSQPVVTESPNPNLEHKPVVGHKFFNFPFYKASSTWRQLPTSERERHIDEFCKAIGEESRVSLKAYSTIGLRKDADFFLWLTGDSVEVLQSLSVKLYKTTLVNFLSHTYNFLAMMKASPYSSTHTHKQETPQGDSRYAFVYPFVKTRAWYKLPFEERMGMMKEHTAIGHDFPSVKINTAYSFGIDDQEFTLCFESDHPDHFVNLVQKLRESRSSSYTERDTPMFVGERKKLRMVLKEVAGL